MTEASMREKLGVCQWFHYEAYEDVERAVELMRELGIKHLRTGISWADWHRPGGPAWYDWQMKQLEEFEVLLSIWHTPPSIAEGGICGGPPLRLDEYAEFCCQMIDRHGHQFADLELWNEPNNHLKWAFHRFDPQWEKFGRMIRRAARATRERGKRNVLGGMIPVDHHWLNLMESYGALDDIDVVAIHAFPGMWWEDAPNWDWFTHWGGWDDKVAYIAAHAGGRPIWCTETGLATCEVKSGAPARRDMQVARLRDAAAAPVERQYWYCLVDLHPAREAIEGFHVDENEYHLGLVSHAGEKKEAFFAMKDLLSARPSLDAQRQPTVGRDELLGGADHLDRRP